MIFLFFPLPPDWLTDLLLLEPQREARCKTILSLFLVPKTISIYSHDQYIEEKCKLWDLKEDLEKEKH